MPNGLVQVYGTVELVLEMSEWRGKIQAFIVDLGGTDFDVVLGFNSGILKQTGDT